MFFCFQVGQFFSTPEAIGFSGCCVLKHVISAVAEKRDHTQTFLLGGSIFEDFNWQKKSLTRKTCLTWEVCFNVKWVSSLTIILWLPFSEQQWNIRQNYIVDAYKCTSYIGKGGFPTNFDFVGIRDKYFTICWCTIVWLGVLLFKDIRLTSWNGKKYNNASWGCVCPNVAGLLPSRVLFFVGLIYTPVN